MTTFTRHYPAPKPRVGERPSCYADRVGQWHCAAVSDENRRDLGQYLTPVPVAEFMASLINPTAGTMRILDPGAGSGVLCCALCEALASRPHAPRSIEVCAYDLDQEVTPSLQASLRYAQSWLADREIACTYDIRSIDFVRQHAAALEGVSGLFDRPGERERYDVVICNPPYFKIPKSDPRAQLAAAVVHGQPNMYALFMAIAASLLKPDGELVFITPRSYSSGPYFRRFRECFFGIVRPTAIHLFGSRTDAFDRDEVLQENVVIAAQREDRWWQSSEGECVKISRSDGVDDLDCRTTRNVPLTQVISYDTPDRILHIPVSHEDDEVRRIVRSWPGSLQAYGLEISTGPVVPFRATPLLKQDGSVPGTHAPLLWMQNVRAMQIDWPVQSRGKEQYLKVCEDAEPILVPNRNYVLLRRFSAKEQARRLIAAPFIAMRFAGPVVGLENHLNYVHRPGGSLSDEEAYGLALLFDSAIVDAYFRTSNGNTQVSATELRAMPLPPLETIVNLGRKSMHMTFSLEAADIMLGELYGWAPDSNRHERA